MYDTERIYAVRRLLLEYVASPSLRHIRDSRSIDRLTEKIVQAADSQPSVWRKWEGQREALLRGAAECWIPIEDLRTFLNSLPGPSLTPTDVAQRLRSIHEEAYNRYPDERLREICLDLYNREVAQGAELPTIIGALQELVEREGERLRHEAEAAYRGRQREEREALERRFLSGADCKWTPVSGSKSLYIRRNGRACRLSRTKAKRWDLFRIQEVEDEGKLLSTYALGGCRQSLAYEPEPRWQ